MVLGLSRQKRKPRHLRLRVESCVNTILDLNERLGDGKIKREIVEQFKTLKESIRDMTDESGDERDIDRIEEATNRLLEEIRISHGDDWSDFSQEGFTH